MTRKALTVVFCCALAACSANIDQPTNRTNNQTIAADNATAQPAASKPNPAQAVTFAAEPIAIKAGSAGEAILNLTVVAPFHVNSNPPSDKNYIPLEIKFDDQNGVRFGKPVYPKGEEKKFSFSENQPLSVYAGDIAVTLPIKIEPSATKGAQVLNGKLSFQACDDEVCYRPQTVLVRLPVTIN